jgi:hypothetical protein
MRAKLKSADARIAELEGALTCRDKRIQGLLDVRDAARRILQDCYMDWSHAGGPGECAHGYAAGIPCKKFAIETVKNR